ncbi:hypothetical protein BO83DRAFT_50710 [Aspergillus eucalypticola CBS 122712]|uniref:Uncharacterized protein n=1 Tax=Aspergillus eucalypticola (strain CBS 122712 / IBT 29274) TaxID=1448314 RepID=A0A317VAA1_ASPEC|nr:uncharacterized protein BO83DRAFT_50710 [Aspergillus eucalypticola CBS 122712]PWY71264.1 hypothetical protein BO83DRAFT_50710 [Aspergillus eucalypticola CBS 122712]
MGISRLASPALQEIPALGSFSHTLQSTLPPPPVRLLPSQQAAICPAELWRPARWGIGHRSSPETVGRLFLISPVTGEGKRLLHVGQESLSFSTMTRYPVSSSR